MIGVGFKKLACTPVPKLPQVMPFPPSFFLGASLLLAFKGPENSIRSSCEFGHLRVLIRAGVLDSASSEGSSKHIQSMKV